MKNLIFIIIFLTLIRFETFGQNCKSDINIYVVSRIIKTAIPISDSKIKNGDLSDKINIGYSDDSILFNNIKKFINNIYIIDESIDKKYNVDNRLLIEIQDSCNNYKLSISSNGILTLNDNFQYKNKEDSLVEIFKKYIEADLRWYDASNEELKKSKQRRQKKVLNDLIDK